MRPDPRGAGLWGLTLVCLLVPLTFAAQWGWTSPRTLGLLAIAAAGLTAFIFSELHATDPLLDLELVFHNRLFAAANLAALLNYMALGAITILTAVYLEVVQGRSASLTGWLMLAQPAVMAALSPFSGRLSDRVGSRLLASAAWSPWRPAWCSWRACRPRRASCGPWPAWASSDSAWPSSALPT